MPDLFSKSIAIKLRVLGWYQIIGGAIGVLLTLWLFVKMQTLSGLIILLFIIAFGLYGLSITAGKKLLGAQYQTGLKLSMINQFLQIVSFLFLGYGYMYVSGMALSGNISYNVGGYGSGFKLGFDLGIFSKWNIDINSDNRSFNVSVNFLAIYLLYFIYRLRQKINDELKTSEISQVTYMGNDLNANNAD
jgi:hypothetical protein